jgi:hypothetical protein
MNSKGFFRTRPFRGGLVSVMMMVMMACAQAPHPADSPLSAIGEQLPKAVGDWRAESAAVAYTPETIFNYIDGHAEVYLAYGLCGTIARRYLGPEGQGDIVVDVFELASPEDAFGVFTHDQDGEDAALGQGSLFRYGWLSFWKGPFFVSIYAEGESEEARAAVFELGRGVAASIPAGGSLPAIVGLLPGRGLDPRSVRYLHDPTILAAHLAFEGSQVLRLGPDAVAALGRYDLGEFRAHLLLVKYHDTDDAESAGSDFSELFLGGGDEPLEHPDGWYAMARLPGDSDVLAFVIRAGSAELAREVLENAGVKPRGGSS